jgi:hypothetical protein
MVPKQKVFFSEHNERSFACFPQVKATPLAQHNLEFLNR